jgi:hypothetical protein
LKESNKWLWGIFAWLVAIAIFFPIFWMAITAFKTEKGAYSPDLIFMPTLESFNDVFARSDYFAYALNSIYISFGSTILCFIIAVPAAYKMCFFPTQKTQSTLLWMLSTKMMPAVGVLLPIYIIFKTFQLLDSVPGLIIIYTLMNLPIAVWMAYTYFSEIPGAILEARPDRRREYLGGTLVPVASDGVARFVIDRSAVGDLCVERSILESQSYQRKCRAADRIYRGLLEPRRAFLGQAFGRIAACGCAHHGPWLADTETVGARFNIWCSEITQ